MTICRRGRRRYFSPLDDLRLLVVFLFGMFAAGLLSFTFFAVALGRPALDSHDLVTRSQHDATPSGYVQGSAPSDSTIRLTIAMPQNNMSGLHAALLDVSDPDSPNYGKHLSKDEVSQSTLKSSGIQYADTTTTAGSICCSEARKCPSRDRLAEQERHYCNEWHASRRRDDDRSPCGESEHLVGCELHDIHPH